MQQHVLHYFSLNLGANALTTQTITLSCLDHVGDLTLSISDSDQQQDYIMLNYVLWLVSLRILV